MVLRGHWMGRKKKFIVTKTTQTYFHPKGEEDSKRKSQALQLNGEFFKQCNIAAWTSKWRKKKFSHQNCTDLFSPKRRRRLRKEIPSTTTEGENQKKSILLVAVSLVDGWRLTLAISSCRGKKGITGMKIIEEKLTINKEADKWSPTEKVWVFPKIK